MKNYWDYSIQERSELTEDQIKALLDVELMTHGALKPVAPVLKEVGESPLGEQATYYSMEGKDKYGGRARLDICFATLEQATKFLALKPLIRDYDYEVGSDYYFAKPVLEGAIAPEQLYTQEQINTHRSTMKQRKAIKEENERKTSEFQKACSASAKITDGVWKDYYASQAKRSKMRGVVDTFNEYLKLTSDDRKLALTFLAKAFDAETIAEAREWFPEALPANDAEVASQPAPDTDPVPKGGTD